LPTVAKRHVGACGKLFGEMRLRRWLALLALPIALTMAACGSQSVWDLQAQVKQDQTAVAADWNAMREVPEEPYVLCGRVPVKAYRPSPTSLVEVKNAEAKLASDQQTLRSDQTTLQRVQRR
jgi:hypothetical protein